MLRIGLLLCGCGALDGSDPLPAIALRIAAAQAGDLIFPLATERDQADVIGLHGALPGQRRNALAESTRLTSGRIDVLEVVLPDEFDLLAVPGGLGVLKTLCAGGAGDRIAGANLMHGVLAGGGALLLLDEGAVWAARAGASAGLSGWALAAGDDPLLRDAVAASGQTADPRVGEWVQDPRTRLLSIALGGDPRPDRVFDLCVAGLARARAMLSSSYPPR